ncbi:glycosyltransferase [Roseomonas sp. GC11]|uniref:glycosyltransferase family 2 protein n=1 Tax=Roseomonas sp. GC11 TaxID=2950546 RepID=UPI00210DD07B|nr:glycosyltransferase [Roseomonas sp. GC11]MCQ4160646.1 glycosyltransferase [Roseomonas sp. GC11]
MTTTALPSASRPATPASRPLRAVLLGAAARGAAGLHGFVIRHPALKRGLRTVLRPALPWINRFLVANPALARARDRLTYQRWIARCDTRDAAARVALRARAAGFRYRPLISIVMPAYETPPLLLRQAIASVKGQLYPEWELCVADDASPSGEVARVLAEEAALDRRIRWVRRESNGHIAAATNSALGLARGEFIALLDHDDLLAEHALLEIVARLQEHPEAELLYTDEDKIDAQGRRHAPYFKPDYDPDLLLAQNYFNHLTVYRRSLLERLGGLREGLEGSQDHDLALRATTLLRPEQVQHVPGILYHWRRGGVVASFSETAAARCEAASRRAVAEALAARGEAGEVLPAPAAPMWHRIRRPVPEPAPLVSVIIPTRDRAGLLERCLDGLLNRTDWPALQLLIADNGSSEAATLRLFARLAADPRVTILPMPGPFNYSALNNEAARHARGELLLLLLNNDIEVLHRGWLAEMVSQALRPGIGAVGARLLYPNGRVQHAGVVLGTGGVAGHLSVFSPRQETGYWGSLALLRSVSAVTGACLMLRRAHFEAVGGLEARHLPVAFNDVDLCLKLRARGLRNIVTPFAELVHHESVSRGRDDTRARRAAFAREHGWMRLRWSAALQGDPYYNPWFDRNGLHHELALAGE